MSESLILRVWQSKDSTQLPALLAEEAVFSSPVADYHGRARAAHLLATIATVLDSVHQTRQWTDGQQGMFAFTARFADQELQGVLREELSETGSLTHVTLFLRPYRALRAAIAEMARRLEDAPPPQAA
ncbi:nuclear transport factor 2 family protein [Nocardia sp. alder85J]|uniref:nuclear transport factor 2 family protein n=1 Tax=Nocardia sp. alder85J TaxID=2862949 RepID=UPI001CD4DBC5|nr:nuclear transport factor 2 family protein [Nocardia sp. alder85J]MCX4094444.1 nuclear transport factor 2 family protein [Nocardia sp. alder85J]